MMDEFVSGSAQPSQPRLTGGPHQNTSIVQAGLDQARQTLFSAADVPLARTDELLAAVSGPALKAVLEARIEQIVKHGHTPALDAATPLKVLPHHARSMILDATDLMDPGCRRNLTVARRRIAKAAAMLLAAIDRIDAELGKGAAE